MEFFLGPFIGPVPETFGDGTIYQRFRPPFSTTSKANCPVHAWCVDQFGEEKIGRWLQDGRGMFYFRYPNDGFAFKIRWG